MSSLRTSYRRSLLIAAAILLLLAGLFGFLTPLHIPGLLVSHDDIREYRGFSAVSLLNIHGSRPYHLRVWGRTYWNTGGGLNQLQPVKPLDAVLFSHLTGTSPVPKELVLHFHDDREDILIPDPYGILAFSLDEFPVKSATPSTIVLADSSSEISIDLTHREITRQFTGSSP